MRSRLWALRRVRRSWSSLEYQFCAQSTATLDQVVWDWSWQVLNISKGRDGTISLGYMLVIILVEIFFFPLTIFNWYHLLQLGNHYLSTSPLCTPEKSYLRAWELSRNGILPLVVPWTLFLVFCWTSSKVNVTGVSRFPYLCVRIRFFYFRVCKVDEFGLCKVYILDLIMTFSKTVLWMIITCLDRSYLLLQKLMVLWVHYLTKAACASLETTVKHHKPWLFPKAQSSPGVQSSSLSWLSIMCLKLIFLYLIDSEYMCLHNMKMVNGRKVPIIKHKPDFRVIRHSFFITNLALLFLNSARRIILGDFMYIWLDKISKFCY